LPQPLKIAAIFGPHGPNILEGSLDFDPEDIFFGPLLRGVEAELDGRARLDLVSAYPADYLKLATTGGYDALMILATELSELPTLRALTDAGIVFVAVGASFGGPNADLPTVDCANREGGAAAARHLIELGHRELGCINLATDHLDHSDRMHGFIESAKAAGCPVEADRCLMNDGYRYDLFHELIGEWVHRLILRRKMPTAILGCDFNMARTAMDVLYARAVDVPIDVSVMGFDDPPSADKQIPPMTTVRQPVREMGTVAARRIMDALLDPAGRRPVVGRHTLPTELVVRDSTVPPRRNR